MKLLRQFKLRKRPLTSIQVEPTSICQLECTMCPRTVYKEEWENGRMSNDVFQSTARIFPLVADVHLQGWGEPLMHPRFFHMVERAKDSGCKVSFTTNGRLLSPKNIDRIFETKVDTVVVSFAGAQKETHEKIRKNSSFQQVNRSILEITKRKAEQKSQTPYIILSYLMMVENISELIDFVKLASRLYVNEVVATNLDFPPSASQKQKSLFNQEKKSRLRRIIKQSGIIAKQYQLEFRSYPIEPNPCVICELNPLHFVYINWKGDISPCVYRNLPKRGNISQFFFDRKYNIQPTIFGNLSHDSFTEIWNTSRYKKFRAAFVTRLKINREFLLNFKFESDSLRKLNSAETLLNQNLSKNPLPDSCQNCYKSLGL